MRARRSLEQAQAPLPAGAGLWSPGKGAPGLGGKKNRQSSWSTTGEGGGRHALAVDGTTYERLPIPTELQAVQALRASARLDAQHKRRTTLQAHHPLPGLTRRETQVLMQLAAGQSNKEIAAALMMSERTVEVHVAHILSKLGCDTRTQAAAYAINRGWVKNQVPF
jgi:DNA-binding CsgD family transcriptional regulator